MIEKTLGKKWSIFSTWSIVVFSYGGCLTFLLLISDQFKICEFANFLFLKEPQKLNVSIFPIILVFLSYYGPNYSSLWYLNTAFTTSICSIFFILPLCFSKGLDFLKWPSSLGFFIICYLIYVIFDKFRKTENLHPIDEFRIPSWYKIFESIPSICFR